MGLEGLFESVVFDCPCEGHFAYGLAFLWAPALLLFLPGIVLDRNLWRHPRTHVKKKASARRCFKTVFAVFDAFIPAAIAPTAWLVLSLLQQQYYTCTYFGPSLDSAKTLQTNTSDKCYFELGIRSKKLEEMHKTRSQIAGWSLMLTAVAILFTSICIHRWLAKGRHLRLPGLEYYRHVEAKEALEQFHIKAKEIAKQNATRNIQLLFQNASNKEFYVRIQEVSKDVFRTYGMFFVIPPESPSYETPVISGDNPPDFPELFAATDGGPQNPKNGHRRHTRLERMEYSMHTQSASGNNNTGTSLSKVKLSRQISIDAV